MAKIHGKTAVFKVGSNDISAYANDISFKQKADTSDTTTFGQTGHTYIGGLTDGTCTVKGIYDNTAVTGPRAAVQALLGTVVSITYQPEGTAASKAQSMFDAVVSAYEESAPVADVITWSADFQISGDVDDTAQSA
jgi:hypothetical protein